MGALQVDTFTGRVGGKQHLHVGIVTEALLRLASLLAPHAAVDEHHRLRTPQQGADASLKVVERVTVLRKQDQLLARRRYRLSGRVGTVRRRCLGDPIRDGGRR